MADISLNDLTRRLQVKHSEAHRVARDTAILHEGMRQKKAANAERAEEAAEPGKAIALRAEAAIHKSNRDRELNNAAGHRLRSREQTGQDVTIQENDDNRHRAALIPDNDPHRVADADYLKKMAILHASGSKVNAEIATLAKHAAHSPEADPRLQAIYHAAADHHQSLANHQSLAAHHLIRESRALDKAKGKE